jgi:hypothetical protein
MIMATLDGNFKPCLFSFSFGVDQGLVLAWQALYHLNHASGMFFLCWIFLRYYAWTEILFVLPCIAGMTGAQHHAQLFIV